MFVWKLIATLSHNLDFFLAILSSYLTIVTFFVVLREKSQNCKICTSAELLELWDKKNRYNFFYSFAEKNENNNRKMNREMQTLKKVIITKCKLKNVKKK